MIVHFGFESAILTLQQMPPGSDIYYISERKNC